MFIFTYIIYPHTLTANKQITMRNTTILITSQNTHQQKVKLRVVRDIASSNTSHSTSLKSNHKYFFDSIFGEILNKI